MTVNIALTGKLRSGKDAVAAHLVANYDYTRFAFGDRLKYYAHDIFCVPFPSKPRELYQSFGQLCRSIDPDVWTRLMFAEIDWSEEDGGIVVSDVRQPNEISALRQRGYTIIRVTCPDDLRLQRAEAAGDVFDLATLTHDTESHVDGFDVDYEIVNDGTLDVLRKSVDALMTELSQRVVTANVV